MITAVKSETGTIGNDGAIELKKNAVEAINRLDRWIDKSGYCGWDPYDIKSKRLFIRPNNLLARPHRLVARKILDCCHDFCPIAARRICGVVPETNAKTIGLLMSAYVDIFSSTRDQHYLSRAIDLVPWLLENRNEEYSGCSWGYPFDWQSVRFIPRGTPSSVVTAVIGDGLHSLYTVTRDRQYLDFCTAICEFFLENLSKTVSTEDHLCFSYTPIDDYRIHNSNLFVGEFLVRIGKEIDDSTYIDTGIKCGNFALSEQFDDGYLPYWSRSQTESHSGGKIHVDHYHSGFEIRSLHSLWKMSGLKEYQNAYRRYYDWYQKNMFTEHGLVKFSPDSYYPVNIHSVAEAILCQSILLDDHPGRLPYIDNLLSWTIENLEYSPGEFTYLIKRKPLLGEVNLRIPMMRWGQAWMFRALSALVWQLAQARTGLSQPEKREEPE